MSPTTGDNNAGDDLGWTPLTRNRLMSIVWFVICTSLCKALNIHCRPVSPRGKQCHRAHATALQPFELDRVCKSICAHRLQLERLQSTRWTGWAQPHLASFHHTTNTGVGPARPDLTYSNLVGQIYNSMQLLQDLHHHKSQQMVSSAESHWWRCVRLLLVPCCHHSPNRRLRVIQQGRRRIIPTSSSRQINREFWLAGVNWSHRGKVVALEG